MSKKIKVSKVGQSDVYVPAYDSDGKTLTVESVMGPGAVPLGGMVVVMPHVDAAAWQPPASGSIKDGFMRADGTVITSTHVSQGCKFSAGATLPSMMAKYPRGNTTSGATGGANTVTIASTNLPVHTHGFGTIAAANESSHTHGVGTYANAAEAAHTHGVGTYANAAEAAHTHGVGTYANTAEAAHTHGVGTYANTAEAAHTHSSALPAHRHFIQSRSTVNNSVGHTHSGTTDPQNANHTHGYTRNTGGAIGLGGGTYAGYSEVGASTGGISADHGHNYTTGGISANHTHGYGGGWSNESSSVVAAPNGDGYGNTSEDGVGYWAVSGTRATSAGSSHNHTFSGSSAAGASHNHVFSGSSAAGASHNHVISGSSAAGASHNHTISGSSAAGASHTHTISGSTDNGGFTNTALNNEPAYIEVIWVIRVK